MSGRPIVSATSRNSIAVVQLAETEEDGRRFRISRTDNREPATETVLCGLSETEAYSLMEQLAWHKRKELR